MPRQHGHFHAVGVRGQGGGRLARPGAAASRGTTHALGQVFIYYEIEGFYQNHRRYVSSRTDLQLRGIAYGGSVECEPYEKDEQGRYYAPCGLIANSLFNDTIRLKDGGGVAVALTGTGIAWSSDVDTMFQNPPHSGDLCSAAAFDPAAAATPPNWPVQTCRLGQALPGGVDECLTTDDSNCEYSPFTPAYASSGEGYENEDFMVWMRTAAMPTFRKLYRRAPTGLADGDYTLDIGYNFPVTAFGGKKAVIISTASAIGGKNTFLAVGYLLVGFLCWAAVLAFWVMQRMYGRTLGDVSSLGWSNPAYGMDDGE